MGARFEIDHANFVGYLTAGPNATAPRANKGTLKNFLMALAYGGGLISSTQGTRDDWTRRISRAADREASELSWTDEVLDSVEVAQRLDPLRTYFTNYPLYAMVLPSGSWEEDRDSFRFFTEAAVASHSNALVLMPEGQSHDLTSVVDPFPALRVLAECPTSPPAAVFWTPLGSSCVLPLHDAFDFFRRDLIWSLDRHPSEVDRLIKGAAARQRSKRILHLSDLHFGTPEAARRRRWLKERLARELPLIDRVVVTGDLFDNPQEPLRESFDEFRTDIESITKNDLLVIPGNHDVRRGGNALGRLGRNSEYVTDLRWEPVVFDNDLQTVFFSFNSSESGNFAKGSVGERQRLDRSALFDREERRNPHVSSFMKIALVHHHPYAYDTTPTALYEKILAGLFGSEDRFVAFDGAEQFMQWCAARGISLVLHGHKHVPHLVNAKITALGMSHEVVVVGCGSTTGAGGRPMCYDIIAMDPTTKRWNTLFYHDEAGDGSGFGLQNVTLDLRSAK
jgi:3',5'-cyclic AMP phosphodiesterase CpdA